MTAPRGPRSPWPTALVLFALLPAVTGVWLGVQSYLRRVERLAIWTDALPALDRLRVCIGAAEEALASARPLVLAGAFACAAVALIVLVVDLAWHHEPTPAPRLPRRSLGAVGLAALIGVAGVAVSAWLHLGGGRRTALLEWAALAVVTAAALLSAIAARRASPVVFVALAASALLFDGGDYIHRLGEALSWANAKPPLATESIERIAAQQPTLTPALADAALVLAMRILPALFASSSAPAPPRPRPYDAFSSGVPVIGLAATLVILSSQLGRQLAGLAGTPADSTSPLEVLLAISQGRYRGAGP